MHEVPSRMAGGWWQGAGGEPGGEGAGLARLGLIKPDQASSELF